MAITSNPILRYQLRKSGMFGEGPFRVPRNVDAWQLRIMELVQYTQFWARTRGVVLSDPSNLSLGEVARCFTRLQNIVHGRSRRTRWKS